MVFNALIWPVNNKLICAVSKAAICLVVNAVESKACNAAVDKLMTSRVSNEINCAEFRPEIPSVKFALDTLETIAAVWSESRFNIWSAVNALICLVLIATICEVVSEAELIAAIAVTVRPVKSLASIAAIWSALKTSTWVVVNMLKCALFNASICSVDKKSMLIEPMVEVVNPLISSASIAPIWVELRAAICMEEKALISTLSKATIWSVVSVTSAVGVIALNCALSNAATWLVVIASSWVLLNTANWEVVRPRASVDSIALIWSVRIAKIWFTEKAAICKLFNDGIWSEVRPNKFTTSILAMDAVVNPTMSSLSIEVICAPLSTPTW